MILLPEIIETFFFWQCKVYCIRIIQKFNVLKLSRTVPKVKKKASLFLCFKNSTNLIRNQEAEMRGA